MNRQQIEHILKNPLLDSHTRESLRQLLHYMTAEGVAHSKDSKLTAAAPLLSPQARSAAQKICAHKYTREQPKRRR